MRAARQTTGPGVGGGAALPWRLCETGAVIRIRLTPRSSRSEIDGLGETAEGPAFLARVNAVPSDNAANTALTELVAAWLQCPKRDVALAGGGKSRIKSIAVAGDPETLGRRLSERLSALAPEQAAEGRRGG